MKTNRRGVLCTNGLRNFESICVTKRENNTDCDGKKQVRCLVYECFLYTLENVCVRERKNNLD